MVKNTIYCGDNLEILKSFPDNSVDSVVTDPPYGIGTKEPSMEDIVSYVQGKSLDTGGDFLGHNWEIPSVLLWKEVFRVLKPGGYVGCWASTRTWDLMALGLRSAGFECRDTVASQFGPPMLAHIFGSGFPKSINITKQLEKKGVSPEEMEKWKGFGTALKPAWEPILIFRKPLESPTIADNVVNFGAGGINIEGTRVKHSSLSDFEAHKASVDAVKASGGTFKGSWKNSSDLSGASDVTFEGRWPPNVLLTHSDSCVQIGVKELPSPVINRFDDGMKPFGEGAGHTYHTVGGDKVETVPVYDCHPSCPVKNMDMQSGATTVYAKFSGRSRRGLGYGENRVVEETVAPQYTLDDSDNGASKYFPTFHPLDVPFKYNPKSNKAESTLNGTIPNEHPTVKPLSLAAWVVRLLTPKGGVVLDPYAGSGSIPCAAVMEGFDTIGIDRWESVVEQTARPRLAHYLKQREEREDAEDIFNLAFGDPTAEP